MGSKILIFQNLSFSQREVRALLRVFRVGFALRSQLLADTSAPRKCRQNNKGSQDFNGSLKLWLCLCPFNCFCFSLVQKHSPDLFFSKNNQVCVFHSLQLFKTICVSQSGISRPYICRLLQEINYSIKEVIVF